MTKSFSIDGTRLVSSPVVLTEKLTEVWDVSASLNVLFLLASINTLKPRLNLKKKKLLSAAYTS